jgi:CBS-domain-containing membrane protein
MTTIHELLKEKGSAYFSVHPDETVYSAIKKMGEKGIGALLVMDRATLVGILTERDYAPERSAAPETRSAYCGSHSQRCGVHLHQKAANRYPLSKRTSDRLPVRSRA